MTTHNGPESRLAQYLAKIAGEDVPTPKPSTEAEIYLNKIAQSGGGSGGGGGVFVVRITSPDGGDTYTADKTYAEILAAYRAGMWPVARLEDNGDTYFAYSIFSLDYLADDEARFSTTPLVDSAGIGNAMIYIYPDGSVSYVNTQYPSA